MRLFNVYLLSAGTYLSVCVSLVGRPLGRGGCGVANFSRRMGLALGGEFKTIPCVEIERQCVLLGEELKKISRSSTE